MTLLPVAATLIGTAVLFSWATDTSDKVTVSITTTKERAEVCSKTPCTMLSREEIDALVGLAQKMQRERDTEMLDSNGCIAGKT